MLVGGVTQALQPPAVPPDAGSVPSASSPETRAAVDVAASAQRPAVPPTLVTLPGANVRVVHAGVTRGGLDLPENVDEVGWWVGGAGVTSTSGTIVIAGHVDSARQGPGAFARLRTLATGTRVRLTAASGASRTFVVTGRRSYAKSTGLPSSLFEQSVGLRLVLITCTGEFDPVKRSYADNLVVFAAPA